MKVRSYDQNQSGWRSSAKRRARRTALVLALVTLSALSLGQASAESEPTPAPSQTEEAIKRLPANHRMDSEAIPDRSKLEARRGRQYDGSMGASGSGSYAAVANEAGAYAGMPLAGFNPISSSGASGPAYGPADSISASSGLSGFSAPGYHDQMSLARGYPAHYPANGYPPMASYGGGGPGGALASLLPASAGMFSTSSSAFPLMAKGFDVAEIVCTAIAVAIGAVIVGAPFILLYLFVMNQMQGAGPSAMGPGGGSISLTGPTASTNVGGRKKRHTSLPEALFRQLEPLMNNEQLTQTFKTLMNALAKYQA